MYKEQVYITTNLALVLDGLVVILAGYGAYYVRWYMSGMTWAMSNELFLAVVLSLMFFNCFAMGRLGFYSGEFNPRFVVALRRVALAVVSDFAVLTLGLSFFKEESLSRTFLFFYAALTFAGMMIVRGLFYHFFQRHRAKGYGLRRILLVGNRDRIEAVVDAFKRQKSWGHVLVGWLSVDEQRDLGDVACLGRASDLEAIATNSDIDEVVFSVRSKLPFDFPGQLDLCKKMGLTCRIVPGMFNEDDDVWGVRVDSIDTIPALTIYGTTINASGLFYKRLLDLVGGAVGFLMFCLLYVPIAVAIKIESPGPVLFSQVRVGQNNRHFKLYKFRSMYMDAEERKKELLERNEMEGHMFKMEHDPRVTRVGRFLRRTSLDEFPQFINVIKGEMSLVGTRPPTVDEVEHYRTWHRRRISMKPGVTGLWQVSGRNEVRKFEDVVALDLEYIDGWHFRRDLNILFKTIWVIFNKQGAS